MTNDVGPPPGRPGSPDPPEPTASAHIQISLGPGKFESHTQGVPPGETHTLITVAAEVGVGVFAIAGADAIMEAAPVHYLDPYAAVALAVLVFAYGVIRTIGRRDHPAGGRPSPRRTEPGAP